MNHVIKYESVSSKGRVTSSKTWCGGLAHTYDFRFLDAQHVALNTSAITPCQDCVNEIIKALKQ